ncbi:ABC transporter substrate-binding protein [Ignicoccus pacificus DSM 13166]|uniref:ABC transporter substrate-binding protein n=1 Tax=Ignicoccus pacificus DSM 13166 TaxID=940294 RepID=A0A977K9N0_9CREN|nr:ABC transporter substrate-binding protein [Ignicoccus pacificus DSM 13166]
MKKIVLVTLALVLSASALTIFSAGSLSIPLREVASVYQSKYHDKVYIEFSGSVQAVRKIVELGRCPDLLFVADYSLIPTMMPSQWVVGFASNVMTLTYVNPSLTNQLRKDWIGTLMTHTFAFSNPNMDPAGYRTLGVLALAALKDPRALKILERINGVKVEMKNGNVTVYVYPNIRSGNGVIIRDKSVDLIPMVKSGLVDIAFEYRSVAIQHKLLYYVPPSYCNLGDPKEANFYGRVKIVLMAGTPKEKVIKLKPIVYGVTIPTCAPHPAQALKFFQLVLSGTGREIFMKNGQNFLNEMVFVPPK